MTCPRAPRRSLALWLGRRRLTETSSARPRTWNSTAPEWTNSSLRCGSGACALFAWRATTVHDDVVVASHVRVAEGCHSARLIRVNFRHRVGEGLGSFLRQVVADAARDGPVRVSTREFVGVSTGVGVWRAIGIALQRDRWNRDHRTCGKLVLQIVMFRVAVS